MEQFQLRMNQVENLNATEEFKQGLIAWSDEFKVSNTCITHLLKLLKLHPNAKMDELPNDGRTLKKTPRNTSKLIRNVHPGEYVST